MLIHLFGERVGVTELTGETEVEGILLPEGYSPVGKDYRVGNVVATPNWIVDGKTVEGHVEVGQMVMFQIPTKITEGSTYKIPEFQDGKPFAIILQSDILGILKSPKVNIDTFQIAGNWVLLEIKHNTYHTLLGPDGSPLIEVPENFTPALTDIRVTVVQKGLGSKNDDRFQVGDEVFVERMRCNVIYFENTDKEYAFILKDHIYGAYKG